MTGLRDAWMLGAGWGARWTSGSCKPWLAAVGSDLRFTPDRGRSAAQLVEPVIRVDRPGGRAGATAWLRRFSVSCRGRERHLTHQDRTARIRHRRLRRAPAAAGWRRV